MNAVVTLVPKKCAGLVNSINAGNCVLVLGPRVAMPYAICPAQTCIDEFFSSNLRNELVQDPKAPNNLRAVFTRYEREKSEIELRSTYAGLVAALDDHTTPLHKDLATLPFRLVLQATHDRMMFNALRETPGKEGVQEDFYDCDAKPVSHALTGFATSEQPLVYSLFGRHDHASSMVLTDKNLLEYLICLTRELPKLPDPVRATLCQPSTSFLFVGFGFSNWWLRLLFKVLQITGVEKRLLSLAFEDQECFDAAMAQENKGFFDAAGIYIQPGDWGALTRELVQRYRESAPATPRPPASPGVSRSSQGPFVFLSYASQDRELVTTMRNNLETRGIRVWQDKQNLRGGQNWELQIEEIIKRVDYFVFIQTENMDARSEGEFNNELQLALRRRRNQLPGEVFVLHVVVGNCRQRVDLKDIHQIVLEPQNGFDTVGTPIIEAYAEKLQARAPAISRAV